MSALIISAFACNVCYRVHSGTAVCHTRAACQACAWAPCQLFLLHEHIATLAAVGCRSMAACSASAAAMRLSTRWRWWWGLTACSSTACARSTISGARASLCPSPRCIPSLLDVPCIWIHTHQLQQSYAVMAMANAPLGAWVPLCTCCSTA